LIDQRIERELRNVQLIGIGAAAGSAAKPRCITPPRKIAQLEAISASTINRELRRKAITIQFLIRRE
jgi:hypothetical protein